MNPIQKPLVILLDLDGTLAGKVTSVLCEYEVHKALAADLAHKEKEKGSKVSKQIRESIVSRLRYGIIRPHVVDFCRGTAEMGAGIELFVFTASENTWANFFVPCVEAALGFRFNRPIFTRNHCVIKQLPTVIGGGSKKTVMFGGVNVMKSITKLRPQIFRALKRKYPGLHGPNDLVDRVILVDNTPHVMADPRESSKLVVCPTYNYAYIYDVIAQLPVDVLHAYFSKLVPVLQRNGMFPTGTWLSLPGSAQPSTGATGATGVIAINNTNNMRRIDTYNNFAAVYYRRLARLLDAAAEPNDAALWGLGHRRNKTGGERFFLDLLNSLRTLVSQRYGENAFDDAGTATLSAIKSFSKSR